MTIVTTVGEGYNSVADIAADDSALSIIKAQQHDPRSISTTYIVTSELELLNGINKSVSAAADATWSGGSVRASYAESFAKSCNMTSSSVAVVITTMVRKREASIKAWRWKAAKQCPTDTAEVNAFVSLNGDAFITSLTYGASYSCAFVFQTNSQQSSEEVQRQLAVKGIVSGCSIDTKMAASLQQVVQETNTDLFIHQSVTGISCAHPEPNPCACTAFAMQFSSCTVPYPTIICYSWIGYETVTTNSQVFEGVVFNRSLIARIAEREDHLKQIKQKIITIREMHGSYGCDKDEGPFAVALEQIKAEEAALKQHRQYWNATPGIAFPALPPQNCNSMPYLPNLVCSPKVFMM